MGQKVFELPESRLSTGPHAYNFDGSQLSSGIYMIKINARGMDGVNYVDSKKIVISK
jgi:hypothetical protein